MTADNPEAVLEDGGAGEDSVGFMAGSMTLFVAFWVTVFVLATGAGIEFVGLAMTLWGAGTLLRVAEVCADA